MFGPKPGYRFETTPRHRKEQDRATDSSYRRASGPREPFYHPAGDPSVQYNEYPERIRCWRDGI